MTFNSKTIFHSQIKAINQQSALTTSLNNMLLHFNFSSDIKKHPPLQKIKTHYKTLMAKNHYLFDTKESAKPWSPLKQISITIQLTYPLIDN